MGHDNIKVSASILSADFLNLGTDIQAVDAAGAHSLHLDVMDNHLAPNISFGPPIIKHLRRITQLPLDTHLMIDAPWLFFDDYIALDVSSLCFHIECYDQGPVDHDLIKTQSRVATQVDYDRIITHIDYLKSKGVEACITINPDTDIALLQPLYSVVDSILVMSVHPGFSGQSFIESTLDKVRTIRKDFSGDIKVDGGVNADNAPALIAAGATVLITASYLFGSDNYTTAIEQLNR